MKVTIIGAGNMGGAIAKGLAKGSFVKASDITCSGPNQSTLDKLLSDNKDFNLTNYNAEAVKGADIVILAVKPWLMDSVIHEIKESLDYEKQIIISIAGGITFEQLSAFFLKDTLDDYVGTPTLFRVIPNTAIAVQSSMTFIASNSASRDQEDLIVNMFSELGTAMLVDERLISAGTSLASCGIAFAFRYIRAAMEGGVELGFYPDQAKEIIIQTIKGAAELLEANKSHPEAEIDKVTTPGGITIKGLNEMEAAGFTTAVIRGLRASK